jgi:signal transduction histidine kinase
MAGSAVASRAGAYLARGPTTLVLWSVALGGCAAAAGVFWITVGLDEQGATVDAALVAWIILSYVGCGLVAWMRRPESRFGPLMIAAGFGPLLSRLAEVNASLPQTVGEVCRLLPVVLFLHVFLAYPSGVLEGRFERSLMMAAYPTVLGLSLVAMMLGQADRDSAIEIAHYPVAAGALLGTARVTTAALALAGLIRLFARAGSSPARIRRSLVRACFVLALATVAIGIVSRHFEWPAHEPIKWVAFTLIGIAPALFLVGFLRVSLARSAVADLFIELRADPAPADLRAALARALGDPSLELVYWLPEFESYVDLNGQEAELGGHRSRAVTPIDRDGSHVAALLHDPALSDHKELLEAVTAAAAISIENARLQAELRARLEDLRGSRARILEAGQMERKRLERNLHDGAQQRLIALSLELGLLEEGLKDDVEATKRLTQAKDEIATSLEELRDIARGIHPAVVSGHGLEIALEQLVARGAVPVSLTVAVGNRLPEGLEVAAFYVVSESLANIGKHANASTASVEVARVDDHVVVEVIDDGIGGADTERGSGLRSLADRVEALEGRLRIWSPEGGGTRLRAEIPCAS